MRLLCIAFALSVCASPAVCQSLSSVIVTPVAGSFNIHDYGDDGEGLYFIVEVNNLTPYNLSSVIVECTGLVDGDPVIMQKTIVTNISPRTTERGDMVMMNYKQRPREVTCRAVNAYQ